ncbi:MAG: hypothetical protein V3V08_14375 [Nannocystaceae bacterium]
MSLPRSIRSALLAVSCVAWPLSGCTNQSESAAAAGASPPTQPTPDPGSDNGSDNGPGGGSKEGETGETGDDDDTNNDDAGDAGDAGEGDDDDGNDDPGARAWWVRAYDTTGQESWSTEYARDDARIVSIDVSASGLTALGGDFGGDTHLLVLDSSGVEHGRAGHVIDGAASQTLAAVTWLPDGRIATLGAAEYETTGAREVAPVLDF